MSLLSTVEDRLARRTVDVQRRVGQAQALAQQGKKAAAEAKELAGQIAACEEASVFLNSFADERQREVQTRVERLVTHGLTTIFGDDLMHFYIRSEQKANRTEVTFHLRSLMGEEVVETPILDARGGGVAAVVGFLLRLVILLLRGTERPLLVLDETWAQLSVDFEPRMAEFVRELVDRTGVQILLVTHSETYSEYADRVYRVKLVDGVSVVQADTSA